MKLFLSLIVIASLLHLGSCKEETPEKFSVYRDSDHDEYGNQNESKEVTKNEDGYVTDDTDCDDNNAAVNPGATEIPDNAVDENCDNVTTTTYYQDLDNDEYGNVSVTQIAAAKPNGYVTNSTDCDDNNADVHPDATEIPDNGVDENCDDVTTTTYYQDLDNDEYGNVSVAQMVATKPNGYVTNSTDCNDIDANINPNAAEIRGNVVDENCDGVAAPAVTGDGIIDIGEQCDDGNPNSGDGCSSTSTIESGYQCTGSPSECTIISVCADGVVQPGEQCDDGNASNGDGCSSVCTIESGYVCFGSPSACSPICGDGIKTPSEQCDDGNTTNGDGCSSVCTIEVGYVCFGSPSACNPICGDGIKTPSEQCDDGNTTNGDGCSSTCTVEIGYQCTGSPSVCTVL